MADRRAPPRAARQGRGRQPAARVPRRDARLPSRDRDGGGPRAPQPRQARERARRVLVRDRLRRDARPGQDVLGLEVNLASKLGEDRARRGEILLTEAAVAALPPALRSRLEPGGEVEFTGRPMPVARLSGGVRS